jgi:hypothetical protein
MSACMGCEGEHHIHPIYTYPCITGLGGIQRVSASQFSFSILTVNPVKENMCMLWKN